MRQIHAALLALTLLLAAASLVALLAPSEAAAPVAAQGRDCRITTGKGAAPGVLALGYSTQITLSVKNTCPFTDAIPTHVVLVVHGREYMTPANFKAIIDANRELVRLLKLDEHPSWEVGVVSYMPAKLQCDLTHKESEAIGCIGRIKQAPGAQLELALDLARRTLQRGRPAGGKVQEIVVAIIKGGNNTGCYPIMDAAHGLRADGIRLIFAALLIGEEVGTGVEECVRSVVESGDGYIATSDGELGPIYRNIAQTITPLGWVRVFDLLPPDMKLVPGSVLPAPFQVSSNRLEWRFESLPARGITVSLWVTPQQLGDHATNQSAGGELVDERGQRTPLTFPVPMVKVVDNAGVPTPTPFATTVPTPTATRVGPGPTRTPAPTATPSAGPAPCPGLRGRVPDAVILDALANPDHIGGWGQRCQPNLPPGPTNGLRTRLTIQQTGKPYHPLFNGLVYRCGCP
jgi:hypothetical protein